MDVIKNQREKQLDAIERQKERDEIIHLKDKIDKLFKMCHKFFGGRNKVSLKSIASNENTINYRNLSYKILFSNGKLYELNFFKKYGTLYDLLENVLAKKTSVDSANADQISFLTNLMRAYDESKLIDIETIKDIFYLHNALLTKAERVFLRTKKKSRKGNKEFSSNQIQIIPSKRSGGCFIKCNAAIQLQK